MSNTSYEEHHPPLPQSGAAAGQCGGGRMSQRTPSARAGAAPGEGELVRCLRISLILCPEVPRGTRYQLRTPGSSEAPRVFDGVLPFEAPSLNLARIRHRGACLGASEVVLELPEGHAIPMPSMP